MEQALRAKMGREVSVMVRSKEEILEILKHNPYTHADGAQVGVMLLKYRVGK